MTSNPGSSAGSNVGQKLKGAFQTVHGLGESLRGNAMDFVDSATGTARSGHGATERGETEAQAGIAKMEGRAQPVGTAPNGVNDMNVGTGPTNATTGTIPATTGAATDTTAATTGTATATAGSAVPGAGPRTLPPGSSTGY